MSEWRRKVYRRSLIDLIEQHLPNEMLGAEIGVFRGFLSKSLLLRFPKLHLLMIDRYKPDLKFEKRRPSCAVSLALPVANDCTGFARDRRSIIVDTSANASRFVADESLDFVFIDGDHSYEGVKQDMLLWYPKVRYGGLFSGHDYDYGDVPIRSRTTKYLRKIGSDIKRAVDEFFEERHMQLKTAEGHIWWTIK